MSVVLREVSKAYPVRRRDEPIVALDRVSLEVAEGELLVVVGPSGSGKSTLLRCVAGLESLTSGTVGVGGADVTSSKPGERDIAMVFQDHALFPHLTVRQNIAFGMRARKEPPAEITPKVAEAVSLMGLEPTLDRRPGELSGGERQRVALARAIVRKPKVFLMDEPLSDLDAELRTLMRAEIHRLQRRLGTTTIYVTHDQAEAMTMGDRVAVLRAGKLEQVASPVDLYDRPANAFVARFIGSPAMNVFPAALLGSSAQDSFGVRPERVRLRPANGARLTGRVVHVETIGHESIVHVGVGDHTLLARVPRAAAPATGSDAGVDFDDGDIYRFAADGTAR